MTDDPLYAFRRVYFNNMGHWVTNEEYHPKNAYQTIGY